MSSVNQERLTWCSIHPHTDTHFATANVLTRGKRLQSCAGTRAPVASTSAFFRDFPTRFRTQAMQATEAKISTYPQRVALPIVAVCNTIDAKSEPPARHNENKQQKQHVINYQQSNTNASHVLNDLIYVYGCQIELCCNYSPRIRNATKNYTPGGDQARIASAKD